jgi:16S rRNA (cytosine1402-N4)-methyltransferase
MMNKQYHQPVLLKDCINGLNIRESGIYADVTFGGGGHSREIIKKLGSKGKLIVFDQDPDAVKNIWEDKRLTFIPQNFRHLSSFLRLHGIKGVDGILADLGVSSHQFDTGERGFSIRFEGPLDMRMSKSGTLSAEEILNSYDERKLNEIFRTYGEINESGRLARSIVNFRSEKRISSTEELKSMIKSIMPIKEKQNRYMARIFQALRIEVNDEMGALKEFLDQAIKVLNPGGRLVVLSYHSLEDRMVKNLIKTGNTDGKIEKDFYGNIYRPFKQINKKPIEPDAIEIENNKRSRSAKLRIAEKI